MPDIRIISVDIPILPAASVPLFGKEGLGEIFMD